jgi:hypothetical protein
VIQSEVVDSEVLQNWFHASPFFHESDAPHEMRYRGDDLAILDKEQRTLCTLSFSARLQIQEAADKAAGLVTWTSDSPPPAARIIEVLGRGPATCSQVAEELRLNSDSVRIYLWHLKRKGRVGSRRERYERLNTYFLIPLEGEDDNDAS